MHNREIKLIFIPQVEGEHNTDKELHFQQSWYKMLLLVNHIIKWLTYFIKVDTKPSTNIVTKYYSYVPFCSFLYHILLTRQLCIL